ncbi:MAG: hypothetical protein J5819_03165 [Eubacterium sp.]|nr:hypothetical protein [Eubacterium sp.]
MYLSSKKHLLSTTLIITTLIQLVSTASQHVLRRIMGGGSENAATGIDISVWIMQHTLIACAYVLSLIVIMLAIMRVKHYIGVVDKDDRAMMGRLQEDKFGENLSALPAEMIQRLLGLWAVILTGIGILQTIFLVMYHNFIVDVSAIDNYENELTTIYSHMDGFKNLIMIFALLLGVVITAVMLGNKTFTIISAVVAVALLLAFCILNINKVALFGVQVGISWTSIAFQLISTVGMILFAIYLRVKYKGV